MQPVETRRRRVIYTLSDLLLLIALAAVVFSDLRTALPLLRPMRPGLFVYTSIPVGPLWGLTTIFALLVFPLGIAPAYLAWSIYRHRRHQTPPRPRTVLLVASHVALCALLVAIQTFELGVIIQQLSGYAVPYGEMVFLSLRISFYLNLANFMVYLRDFCFDPAVASKL